MKTMFLVSFEEFNDDDGCDLKLPIAVFDNEKSAWQFADVVPFESNVTEVVYINDSQYINSTITYRNGEPTMQID